MSVFKTVFKKNGYEFDEHLDILVDLTCSVEQLEQNLHKERKRNIAKAVREGLVFKHLSTDEEINMVSGLLKKTYNRVKLPMIFQQLFLNTRNLLGDEVHFFGAYYGDKMIAGQVRLYYKDVVYAWYSGSNAEYFNKRPNDFLMWNVLLWSKEKGYKLFDFGGAGKPHIPYGVREYKLKYGGQLVNFGRFEKTHKQLFMILGKRALKLYKVIKK
jgi:lipid II:glycine glycyltransferase (peptidoglycan interpeptide bridge formation enzyme)